MQEIQRFVLGLLGAVLRVALWVFTALLALVLLGFALVLIVLGMLWALVRGRRPTPPVFAAQFRRYAAGRVWPPGTAGPFGREADATRNEVVDVEVREVTERDRQRLD